jgi:hypothetical protein
VFGWYKYMIMPITPITPIIISAAIILILF